MTGVFNPDHLHYVTVNGIRTRYLDIDRGTGSPIVLIHGGHFGIFVPMAIEVWSETAEPLAKYGRVVAFDKLGQGWTDLPPSDEQWTFDGVVAHAKALLVDELNLDDMTLVGHSRGGLLAARLAIEIPDRVRRLVVVSSASAAPTQPGAPGMAFYDDVARSAPADRGAEAVVAHYHAAQAIVEGPLSDEYLRVAGEMMNDVKHRKSVEGYARTTDRYWTPSLERANRATLDHLESTGLDIPVLVVWGQQDRSAPIDLGHRFFSVLARHTDDCAMYVINRAGHQVFRDQPSAFCAAVSGFLARTTGRTAPLPARPH